MASWQARRAATMAPRLPKIILPPETPCFACEHPRSSHNRFALSGRCKAEGCTCQCYDAMCRCGHLLAGHMWGTPPHPYECEHCPCVVFVPALPGQGRLPL